MKRKPTVKEMTEAMRQMNLEKFDEAATVVKKRMETVRQSPGFRRMQERMGSDAERLRLDTVARQEAAMSGVRQPTQIDISKCKPGQRLIFTHRDGKREECEFLFKGLVPGCVVVRFFDRNGRPTSHDGLTLPIRQLSEKKK